MTAPKVTQEDVDNEIRTVEYIVLPDGRTTICMLTLVNGYTVRGESSCVHIDNFNEKLGQKYSLENAKNAVWPLLGFRLADKLYAEKMAANLSQVAKGLQHRNELWDEIRDVPVGIEQSSLYSSVYDFSLEFKGKKYNYMIDIADPHAGVTPEHVQRFLNHVVDEYLKAERGTD